MGWILLGFSLGCADKAVDPEGREPESDVPIDEDDDTEEPCESTEGELSGRILRAWSADESPSPDAQLTATPKSDEASILILADEQGRFSALLPADSYDIIAQDDDSCTSEVLALDLRACANIVETFRLIDCPG